MYPPIVVESGTKLGRASQIMKCPACHNVVLTKMRSSFNTETHILALILCGLGCWPCAVLPYCLRCTQDIDHYCPLCETYLGIIIVPAVPVGCKSERLACPACHAQITTVTKPAITTRTHIVALILFVFLLWPCILIPYCTNCCKNIDHYCPNCQALIGTYVHKSSCTKDN